MSNNDKTENNLYYNRIVLTPKQKEVLGHLAEGLQNKEIAKVMNLSVSRVKLHVSGILLRMNVRSRTAAIITAQKAGLI